MTDAPARPDPILRTPRKHYVLRLNFTDTDHGQPRRRFAGADAITVPDRETSAYQNTVCRAWPLALCVLLAACAGPRMEPPSHFGSPTPLTCVPYARAVSGIQLDGNAWEWWDEAAGLYPRSSTPLPGAVLVFAPRGTMTDGHLAVVTQIENRREIMVTQSNWLPHRIEHDQPILDVSPGNNWTEVRVWYEPAHAMGRTLYPAYGFILPR